jgi:Fanconi-associated nuclease 1
VVVSLLEQQQRWGEAVELLQLLLGGNACVGRRGEWWARLAIDLEHLGQEEAALEVGGWRVILCVTRVTW